MGFALVTGQHAYASDNVSGTQVVVSLPNNPTPESVICLGLLWFDGVASTVSCSIQDANSNAYTVTANSPSGTNGPSAGISFLAYILSAPGNAHKTVTATFGAGAGTPAKSIFIMEFSVTSGTASFRGDAAGSGTGTTVNTPTITAGSGDLLFSHIAPSGHVNSAGGSWICPETLPVAFGDGAAYILSASGNTALNYATTNGTWDSMGMAFQFTATGSRTALNTRSNPLGVNVGMGWRMPG